jgi:hypothetical protein
VSHTVPMLWTSPGASGILPLLPGN